MKREELYKICKDWMEKQDKLELFRDYDDYFQDVKNAIKEEGENMIQ